MKNISKIIGWVLGIVGIVLGILCLANGGATNEGPVNILLRYSYFLLIAAVVILLLLAIFIISKYELSDEKMDKINQEIEARHLSE